MKKRHLASGFAALVLLVSLALVSGCANSSALKPHGPDTTQVKTYKVRIHYLKLAQSFTRVQSDVVGSLSIDVAKKRLFWNQEPLELVNSHESVRGQKVFFCQGRLIYIGGPSGDGNNGATVILDSPVNGQTYVQVCQTPNRSYNDFSSALSQLDLPKDYYGLVATAKYIDGTPIETPYKLVCSIQLSNDGCFLNKKHAEYRRATLANSNGVIVIENGEDNLVLWPDGEWRFSKLNGQGNQFGGFEGSLKAVYINLRQPSK